MISASRRFEPARTARTLFLGKVLPGEGGVAPGSREYRSVDVKARTPCHPDIERRRHSGGSHATVCYNAPPLPT